MELISNFLKIAFNYELEDFKINLPDELKDKAKSFSIMTKESNLNIEDILNFKVIH